MIPTVTPLQGEEGVFLVQSRSRPEVKHRVEQEGEEFHCGCEEHHIKNKTCAHIFVVAGFVQGWNAAYDHCKRRETTQEKDR